MTPDGGGLDHARISALNHAGVCRERVRGLRLGPWLLFRRLERIEHEWRLVRRGRNLASAESAIRGRAIRLQCVRCGRREWMVVPDETLWVLGIELPEAEEAKHEG